jgi:hypothetical protein
LIAVEDEESMSRRIKPTKILSSREIEVSVAGIRLLFGDGIMGEVRRFGIDLEGSTRFYAVSAKCKEAREAKGLSIKETARALRVPQYRIKQVEQGHIRSLQPEVLRAYVSFLGLDRWAQRWGSANRGLAEHLGLKKRHHAADEAGS